MSKFGRLVRGDAAGLVVIGLLSQVLMVASGPFVARMLGPEGRGQAAIILAAAMVCNQLALRSLGAGISRTVARHGGTARDLIGPYLRSWLQWSMLPAVVAAGLVAALLRDTGQVVQYALLALGLTFLSGVVSLFRSMVLGEGSIRRVNGADLSFVASYVAAVVLLFVFARESPLTVVMLAYGLGQVVQLVLLLRALRPRTVERGTEDPGVRTEVHLFARRAYFSSIGTLDRLGLDSLLIGHVLGAALLGLYSVASSVAAVPAVILSSLAAALLPRMAALEPAAGAALMRRWVLGATIITLPMIAFLWVVFEPLLRIVFGASFAPADWAGRFLAVANSAFAIRLMLNSGAQAQGREVRASRISLVASLGLLAALVVGAHLDGLEGATVGVMAAALLNLLAMGLAVSWTGRDVTAPQTAAADD